MWTREKQIRKYGHRLCLKGNVNTFHTMITEGKKKTLAQAALQFVLSHPAVSVVIPGAKNAKQVLENVGASDGILLSEEELKHIHQVIPSERVSRLA